MDYSLKAWIDKHLPKDKETLSRDAVEILLSLAWEDAKKEGRRQLAAQQEADRYGDL